MGDYFCDGVTVGSNGGGVVGLAGITWLQWDGGGDRGRLAVRVLGRDVRNKVCLEVTVALVDRRRVVGSSIFDFE